MARRRRKKGLAVVGDITDPHGMAVMTEQYLESLRVVNYSDNTAWTHRKNLNHLTAWCE